MHRVTPGAHGPSSTHPRARARPAGTHVGDAGRPARRRGCGGGRRAHGAPARACNQGSLLPAPAPTSSRLWEHTAAHSQAAKPSGRGTGRPTRTGARGHGGLTISAAAMARAGACSAQHAARPGTARPPGPGAGRRSPVRAHAPAFSRVGQCEGGAVRRVGRSPRAPPRRRPRRRAARRPG